MVDREPACGAAAERPFGPFLQADPFYSSAVPRNPHPEEIRPSSEDEAHIFAEAYQRMLPELEREIDELEADQERLAVLLQGAQCRVAADEQLDEAVFVLRDGLDLRLYEVDEGHRRLTAVQRRLHHSLEDAEAQCERDAILNLRLGDAAVDPKLLERLDEQRRVIRLQQEELDQIYFERDVLADDAARLRAQAEELAASGEYEVEPLVLAASLGQPEAPPAGALPQDGREEAPSGLGQPAPRPPASQRRDPLAGGDEGADGEGGGAGLFGAAAPARGRAGADGGSAGPPAAPAAAAPFLDGPGAGQRADARPQGREGPGAAGSASPARRNRLMDARRRAQDTAASQRDGPATPRATTPRRSASGRDFVFGP